MNRPRRGEYGDFYADYVARVPERELCSVLTEQQGRLQRLLPTFGEGRGSFRYAEGKWSVKEVLGHMIDAERVFGHRALCFARGDDQPLPGMDQDLWVRGAEFDRRTLEGLLREATALRESHLALFESFGPREWMKRGTASSASFTVRALVAIIAGHEHHHLEVLEERYA